jgi:hypothetical protein
VNQNVFLLKSGTLLKLVKKMCHASQFCVSSLRRGHAILLCNVPFLVYVLPQQAHLKRKTARFEQRRRREPKCVLLKSGTLLKLQGYSRKTAQCIYKNVERFTILRVILAQGPC